MRTVLTNALYIAALAALADVGTFVSYYTIHSHPLQLGRMWRAYPIFLAIVAAIILVTRLVRFLVPEIEGQK